MSKWPWLVTAIYSGIGAAFAAVAFIWLPPYAAYVFAVGLIVFVLVLIHNPLYVYLRSAGFLLSVWSGAITAMSYSAKLEAPGIDLEFLSGVNSSIVHPCIAFVVVVLFVLHYLSTSQNAIAAAELIKTGASGSGKDASDNNLEVRLVANEFLGKLTKGQTHEFRMKELEVELATRLAKEKSIIALAICTVFGISILAICFTAIARSNQAVTVDKREDVREQNATLMFESTPEYVAKELRTPKGREIELRVIGLPHTAMVKNWSASQGTILANGRTAIFTGAEVGPCNIVVTTQEAGNGNEDTISLSVEVFEALQ